MFRTFTYIHFFELYTKTRFFQLFESSRRGILDRTGEKLCIGSGTWFLSCAKCMNKLMAHFRHYCVRPPYASNFYGFVHLQITVPITKTFIEFLKTQPIIFKVFGHYQHHPLHNIAKQEFATRPPPRRMLPPSIPISQPVRSPKFGPLPCPPSSTVLAKHDILVWFEICELAPSGEYVPSVVEHSDDLPCRGLFLLHQGIQRRIRITIVHEPTPEIKWKDIRELVVGGCDFYKNQIYAN